jgi:phosphoglycerate dehydrogenase-like enzyme
MENITVLVLSGPEETQLSMLKKLPPGVRVVVGSTAAEFAQAAPEAAAIFSWSIAGDVLQQVWRMCPKVRWVHSRSAGLDAVLFPELVASPVPLTNGRGVFSPSLGEFFLTAALYFAKDLPRMLRNQAAERWEQFDVEEIAGRTVAIIGYGDIGRACASRARAMGMKVIAVKRHSSGYADEFVDRTYGPAEIDEAIAAADYIAVTAPLTPETRGLVGPAQIARMKPNAVVINLGRGPVIDEPALIAALTERRIKGAGLDVFDQEPLPAGHPFYRLSNVLLSPHCADHTADWLDQSMVFFLEQLERFRSGAPLLNVVDKKLGY